MMSDLWYVLWFFLPAGVANVMPIVVAKLPVIRAWNYPLDCYVTFRGKRLLGDHKTWRGLVSGVLSAVLVGYAMYMVSYPVENNSFGLMSWLGISAMMGLGALMGDAVKSFVKRQMNIPSGKSFFVFDQIDYILGAALFTFPFVPLPWYQEVLAIVVWGLISLASSYIGFLTRFKKEPI